MKKTMKSLPGMFWGLLLQNVRRLIAGSYEYFLVYSWPVQKYCNCIAIVLELLIMPIESRKTF